VVKWLLSWQFLAPAIFLRSPSPVDKKRKRREKGVEGVVPRALAYHATLLPSFPPLNGATMGKKGDKPAICKPQALYSMVEVP